MSSVGTRIRGRKGQELRKRRLARTNYLCGHCRAKGIVRTATVVNHKIPLAHGGPDTDENTENLCADCDKVETAKVFGHRVRTSIGNDGWPA
jgi:5-methylcytosine-specific restriction protein A